MKYRFIEHTADVKFQAFGNTKEEAFSNAALALFSVMTEAESIEKNYEMKIRVESNKLTSLLYDFLEELLFYMDTEGLLLAHADSINITGNAGFVLEAIMKGDKVNKYDLNGDVKAITYNQMEIKEDNGWMLQAVVDI